MIRVFALVAALTSAAPVVVQDIAGRSWSLLAPASADAHLLFFLSTDCPISNRYAPEISRICREYEPRGVRCVAVYPDAVDVASVNRHRQEFSFLPSMPAVIDRDRQLVRAVGPHVTPEAALYTSAGRVYRGRIDDLYIDVGRSRRAATSHDLRLALDAALGGRSIAQAETEAVGCVISRP